MKELTEREFNLLRDKLLELSGIDVSAEKKYLFTTRLEKFCQDEELLSFSEFYSEISNGNSKIKQKLIESMTTHESSFFRDKYPYELVRENLTNLMEIKQKESRFYPPKLRILSAGCSKGQEPYSLAIIIKEWLENNPQFNKENFTILGTDISGKILNEAKNAIYSELELGAHISPALKRKYFTKKNNLYYLNQDVCSLVRFKEINFSQDLSALGKFDIVFLRNVIIYFPLEIKKNILKSIHRMLPGYGFLVMGSSENTYTLTNDFRIINNSGNIYFSPIG